MTMNFLYNSVTKRKFGFQTRAPAWTATMCVIKSAGGILCPAPVSVLRNVDRFPNAHGKSQELEDIF